MVGQRRETRGQAAKNRPVPRACRRGVPFGLWLPVALVALNGLLGTGCASARYARAARRVQARNPHAAIEYIALAQQRNPDHAGAHDVLIELLQTIPHDHESTLQRLERAGAYDQAVAECDRMTVTDDLVRQLPGARYHLFYRPERRNELAAKAAAQWLERAQVHKSEGRMREAVLAFDRALGFDPDQPAARAQRETARAAAMVRVWIQAPEAGRYSKEAARLVRGTGAEAMRLRPRFMTLAAHPEQADAIAEITIDHSAFQDTGWQGREDSRTVFSEWRDPDTGRVYRRRHTAFWVVYTRHIEYRVSVRMAVSAERADDPGAAEVFSDRLEARGTYATWRGSQQAVPAAVLYLSRRPIPSMDAAVLRDRLLDEAMARFGRALFMAYK